MNVKGIIKLAAELIGRDDVKEYLESGIADDVPNAEAEVGKLLTAYNIALERSALHFEPLERAYREEGVTEIYFSALPDRPLEIISVTNDCGDEQEYVQKLEKLVFSHKIDAVTVRYRYVPTDRALEDEFDYGYLKRTTPRIIAFSVAAEYLHLCGANESASSWRKKYESAALTCLKARGRPVLPKRSWF